MSNPLVSLWHFLERLFGKSATEVEWLLKEVSSYLPQVEEVVSELSALAAADPNNVTNAIAGYLQKFGKVEADAKAWITANAGLTGGDLLRAAAQVIVGTFVPAGTAMHIINFAIEMAYSVIRKKAA